MNQIFKKVMALSVACLGCAVIVNAQGVKQVVKAAERGALSSSGKSALGTMDAWYNAGAALKHTGSASAATSKAIKTAVAPKISKEHALRNSKIFEPITPTPSTNLRLNLIYPSHSQMVDVSREYYQFMDDFRSAQKHINAKLLYQTLPNDKWTAIPPQERRELITTLAGLEGRVEKLTRVIFREDAALIQAKVYLEEAQRAINPFYQPGLKTRNRPDKRIFDEQQFFLKYPRWTEYPDEEVASRGIVREVPENVRMAVLNDTEDILDMYRIWEKQGRLGKGWTVALYKDTREFLSALESGAEYDLIITDITVPGGGGYYLTDAIRNMKIETPIIGCSRYTMDKLDSHKMFDQGFDGYIYSNDMFDEVSGSVAWMGFIKNYYFYRQWHGWSR